MLYGAMNFPVMPILSELEEIKRLGFDYLELAMDPPQAHHKMIWEQKDKLIDLLKNSYRVLLSRGMKGCYVYFMDKSTRDFIRSRIEFK